MLRETREEVEVGAILILQLINQTLTIPMEIWFQMQIVSAIMITQVNGPNGLTLGVTTPSRSLDLKAGIGSILVANSHPLGLWTLRLVGSTIPGT